MTPCLTVIASLRPKSENTLPAGKCQTQAKNRWGLGGSNNFPWWSLVKIRHRYKVMNDRRILPKVLPLPQPRTQSDSLKSCSFGLDSHHCTKCVSLEYYPLTKFLNFTNVLELEQVLLSWYLTLAFPLADNIEEESYNFEVKSNRNPPPIQPSEGHRGHWSSLAQDRHSAK